MTDAQSLLEQAKCYACFGDNQYMLQLMELALLAQIASAGGTGGGGSTIGVVSPQGTVTAAAGSTYYDSVADTFWINLNGATLWKQLI